VVACGGEACRVAVGDEAMRLADEIQKKVVAEDEGFLVPVRNIWIVDKLRADLAACKNELAACKNELAAKDKEIERLKQQISKKK
jgi:hypothetical protein